MHVVARGSGRPDPRTCWPWPRCAAEDIEDVAARGVGDARLRGQGQETEGAQKILASQLIIIKNLNCASILRLSLLEKVSEIKNQDGLILGL